MRQNGGASGSSRTVSSSAGGSTACVSAMCPHLPLPVSPPRSTCPPRSVPDRGAVDADDVRDTLGGRKRAASPPLALCRPGRGWPRWDGAHVPARHRRPEGASAPAADPGHGGAVVGDPRPVGPDGPPRDPVAGRRDAAARSRPRRRPLHRGRRRPGRARVRPVRAHGRAARPAGVDRGRRRPRRGPRPPPTPTTCSSPTARSRPSTSWCAPWSSRAPRSWSSVPPTWARPRPSPGARRRPRRGGRRRRTRHRAPGGRAARGAAPRALLPGADLPEPVRRRDVGRPPGPPGRPGRPLRVRRGRRRPLPRPRLRAGARPPACGRAG